MEFTGLFPAVVTPFLDDLRVDHSGIAKLSRSLLEGGGVSGLVANSNAAEVWALSIEEQAACVRTMKDEAGDGVPVVSGLAPRSLGEGKRTLDAVQSAGADGVLVMPLPEWAIGMDPAAAVRYHEELSRESSIPLVAFQVPRSSAASYSSELLAQIVRVPGVSAVKEAVWDLTRYARDIRATRDADPSVRILSGIDEFVFDTLQIGADGMLLAIGCLMAPELDEIHRLLKHGDLPAARDRNDQVQPLLTGLYGPEAFGKRHATLKACLYELRLIDSPLVRPPATVVRRVPDGLRAALTEFQNAKRA